MAEVFDIVRENFVRKSAADFPEMLKKGLDNLETNIDEILVKWGEKDGAFELVVGENKKSFQYEEPETWKELEKISTEALSFVRMNTDPDEKNQQKIEYTMVNGMLSTLDRHSRIIPPRDYEEFIVETEGSFTGLGIVISTRKGWITVVSPIEDTPAYRAGMKAGDKIVQIENESTVNMSILEAVNRLRGPKGKPVNIRILRDSMSKPKPLTIVRDVIKIESVEDYLFEDGILYIKIKNFQRNTTDSIIEALSKYKNKDKLTGIIIDFRDNPGGLLNQAAQISDLFLKNGTVFSIKSGDNITTHTASAKNRFELFEKTVVLINSGSASASEIVTGALKENDRALTMGRTTFGKGSVQDIFELGDGSALKLTIANYLIPGDVSIHKVGITPDIFIEEVDFDKDKVIYKTPEFAFFLEKYREEREDEKDAREPEPPSHTFKILNESLIGKEDEKEEDEIPPPLSKAEKRKKKETDPLVVAARRIILGSNGLYGSDLLQNADSVLSEIDEEENKRIREKLAQFKIDWSENDKNVRSGEPELTVGITPDKGVFKVGEEVEIKISVKNIGEKPVYKLTAVTDSDNPVLDNREFVFGKIAPGKKASWKAGLKIPKNARTRNDECVVRFFDFSGKEVFSKSFTVGTEGKKRPSISYNYEIVDDGRLGSKGNGDGRIGKNETITLLFRIKNTGEGDSEDLGIYLRNKSGKKLFLEKAIEEIGKFKSGESRDVVMRFRVENDWGEDKDPEGAEFELNSNDFEIGFSSKYDIKIPFREPAEFSSERGVVELNANAAFLGGGFEDAQEISVGRAGSSYRLLGKAGEWSKVRLAKNKSGWVETDKTSPQRGKASPDFQYALVSAPVIKLDSPVVLTDSEEIEISGSVEDAEPIVNISFFNNNDKIHVINSEGKKQSFTFNLPLEDGMNKLTITAKDLKNLKSVRTFYIRKKG